MLNGHYRANSTTRPKRLLHRRNLQPQVIVANAGQQPDLIVGRHLRAQRGRRARNIVCHGSLRSVGRAQIDPAAIFRKQEADKTLAAIHFFQQQPAPAGRMLEWNQPS